MELSVSPGIRCSRAIRVEIKAELDSFSSAATSPRLPRPPRPPHCPPGLPFLLGLTSEMSAFAQILFELFREEDTCKCVEGHGKDEEQHERGGQFWLHGVADGSGTALD